MADHAAATKTSVTSTIKTRDAIRVLIEAGDRTTGDIAEMIGCGHQLVTAVRRSLVPRGVTECFSLRNSAFSERLENSLGRKAQTTLSAIHPKTDSAADTKNKTAAFGILFDKARLMADKSTSNINNRSLAVAVSRRAGGKKKRVASKDTTVEGEVVDADTTASRKPEHNGRVAPEDTTVEGQVVDADTTVEKEWV